MVQSLSQRNHLPAVRTLEKNKKSVILKFIAVLSQFSRVSKDYIEF